MCEDIVLSIEPKYCFKKQVHGVTNVSKPQK